MAAVTEVKLEQGQQCLTQIVSKAEYSIPDGLITRGLTKKNLRVAEITHTKCILVVNIIRPIF